MNNDPQAFEEKAGRLASLIEVSTIISSSLDLPTVISMVMEKAQEVMNAEAGSVLLLNEKTGRLEVQSALGQVGDTIKETISLEIGQGIAGWVAKERKSLNVEDAQTDPRFYKGADKITGFHTRCILAAPLLHRDKLIGVAEVINRKDGMHFSEEDVSLFDTFCRSVAMAVENARLHQETLDRERFQQQLESARAIQQSFLPLTIPQCPRQRYKIYAKYQPAKMIGGDFYDFISLDEDHIGIVIGDVCGKGIPAALYMAHVLNDLRLFTHSDCGPGETLEKLNNHMVKRSRQGLFVTMAFGILNVESGTLVYANGGHTPLFRIQSGNDHADILASAKQIPLGIKEELGFPEQAFELDHGDFLLFLTDGILEARYPDGSSMDEEKLLAMIGRHWESPGELSEFLVDRISRGSESDSQHDDITLVAIEWA